METIEFKGVKLKAVEHWHGCQGCYFEHKPEDECDFIACVPKMRYDGKSVIFIKVQND